ncbi:MAG: Tex family protein [bacterium]|nr:Tex family protein [bacterium]
MNIIEVLAQELDIKQTQAQAAVDLIDEGNTIPFIARYRKEKTGSLNDEVLRALDERLHYLRNLEERKQQVLAAIQEQDKLTETLQKQILEAKTLVAVEDLYLPYRPKRRTRATIAKEKGLEPLAERIWKQELQRPLEEEAKAFVTDEQGVGSVKEAIDGAKDILAERVSDTAAYRTKIRERTFKEGILQSSAKDEKQESVYEMYYQYEEAIGKCAGHRILAMNRGEKEKLLSVKTLAPKEKIVEWLERQLLQSPQKKAANSYAEAALREVAVDSYERLIAPAIEREVRNALTEHAEEGAMKVFSKNLEQLLMQPPIVGQVVLGWDPAFRTGCKLAVVDETGKVLDTAVIYPTAPQNKVEEAKKVLRRLIETYGVSLLSVGNGTASRESEQIIAGFLKEIPQKVQYVIVNEAGASVYSASKLATEEFPQFDVAQRSAVSIARRLQDPLSELVKIDPKSIGVGQYQHDMNQKRLGEVLQGVVEDCVNRVGVDLNTASASLLEYVSGISKTLAKNIVAYREENGAFQNRRQLLKVPKLGPKAFEQCAGFLRIVGGEQPLDATSVHPESYGAAGALLQKLGYPLSDLKHGGIVGIGKKLAALNGNEWKEMAEELGVGEITLRDIAAELEKPARDPRSEMPKPILRTDVLEMKDLKAGMHLKGTVRNVIDFGAFVDIGVHQDGLVHISQMTKRYIKHPLEAVSVGDVVEVRVLSVDLNKKRISLSMLPE